MEINKQNGSIIINESDIKNMIKELKVIIYILGLIKQKGWC